MDDNKQVLISVIIPIYGVEQYLSECIESLLHQTYANLEIILVDDGSPDKCGAICDEYALKDNRIIVVHKENAGVSAARKEGFIKSKGKYIIFVDADDTIPKNAIELLYANVENKDCVVGQFDTSKSSFLHLFSNGNKYNVSDIIKHILKFEKSYRWELWGKLLKRSLLSEDILTVDGSINVFEDYVITLRYLMNINSIVYIPDVVYNYRQRVSGSSTSTFRFTLDFVKSLSALIINAVEDNARDYIDELRQNQLFLLSEVIGDKNLNRRDSWFLQVYDLSLVGHISCEAKLSIFLVKYCPISFVRGYIMSLYQWIRKVLSTRSR